MEIKRKYLNYHLRNYLQNLEETEFSEIFNLLEYKAALYRPLLEYLYKICNNPTNEDEQINVLHIHIQENFSDEFKVFLLILINANLFSKLYKEDDVLKETKVVERILLDLEVEHKKLQICPPGASRENRISRQWKADKKINKGLIAFYKKYINASLIPRTIINIPVKFKNTIEEHLISTPIAVILDRINEKKSYNVINTDKSLNEIDSYENLIDNCDSIILFDCERKSIMSNFSFEEIKKWNSDYDTNFKKYFIFTFGREYPSFENIRNKVDTIRDRFKIPIDTSYIILSSEIDILLNRKGKKAISVDFVGNEFLSFWNNFLLEISIKEIYELRSIKLMNIYSLCLTEDIKNYILDDLFSKNETSELVSFNTKQELLELREDELDTIKESLSNTLDFVISSGIKSKIIEQLDEVSTIILDDVIIRNPQLILNVTKALGLNNLNRLKTWVELLGITSNKILILSYRDQGKKPNYYYPNLVEFEFNSETIVSAILPNFLFGHHYKWSKYYLLKDYHKYLSHPIRHDYFEWNQLKSKIQKLRPESKLKINWDLEYEFSNSEQRELYKIKVKGQKIKTFHSSDFLIYNDTSVNQLRIERVKWIFENLDLSESTYEIQRLDDLLEEFNPADRLIDTTQQERELEIIRKQLGLENETAGRIWKVLLKRKCETIGVEKFYDELKIIFKANNIPLVSINHFQNSWINIESDSLMPRGNKVFKVLCDYLDLKNNYRLILYSLKNASINGKIEATKKYSRLLKDLFSDSCFDDIASAEIKLQSHIEYYRNNHILDEIGIDNENPLNGLFALVQLIQPELKLLELETIEKIEQ